MTHSQRDDCVVTVVPTGDSAVEITAELGDQKLQRTVPAHLSRSDSLQFFRIIQAMKAELCAERNRYPVVADLRAGQARTESLRPRM
jgi:hypothetical protein